MNEFQPESLKACYELEYLLIGDLRQILKEPSSPENRESLLALLKLFLRNLPEVIKLASDSGTMTAVQQKCPRLYGQIKTLQTAHLDCLDELKELHDSMEIESAEEVAKTDYKIGKWIDSFALMRIHESQLLQDAYTVDIGGEA
jgi:hypothetical protein